MARAAWGGGEHSGHDGMLHSEENQRDFMSHVHLGKKKNGQKIGGGVLRSTMYNFH